MPGAKPPFEQVYRDFLQRIYAYVRAQLRSNADAEDVTSQVFIKAYQAYGRFEPEGATPAAWLFQIARNAILDHHRRAGSRERMERTVAAEPGAVSDPELVAQARLRHQDLVALVRRLPDRQREAVALRHSGLSFLEVAAVIGSSEDAAKMLYHRALKALRVMLGEEAMDRVEL